MKYKLTKALVVLLILGIVLLVYAMRASIIKIDFSGDVTSGSSNFTVTQNDDRGYLTAENDVVKVVWHYKTLASEYSNRGGGNIYELYDKRTDPQAQRNLVAVVNSGTAGTGPAKAGIGGLGATYIYEYNGVVLDADNAGQARLVNKNNYIDADGNAVFEATFIVRSKVNQTLDNYQVDKKWIVYKSGQIKLQLSMHILRSFVAAEPAYNFSFNHDYGWTSASSIRHRWDLKTCGGPGTDGAYNPNNSELIFNNINEGADRDNSLLHTQFFTLYGQNNGSSVSVKMDNDGKGLENGGLFSYGASVWGTTQSPTSEYSNFTQLAYGHTLHFYGWWGGGPPGESRYKPVYGGTSWADTLWIEMEPALNREPIVIEGAVQVQQIDDRTIELKWNTNRATSTNLSYQQDSLATAPVTINNESWTPNHDVVLSDLVPGQNYRYTIESDDSSGSASAGGVFSNSGPLLQLNLGAPSWMSYSDYQNRILELPITISNHGISSAIAAEIVSIQSSKGVTVESHESNLGDIATGTRRDSIIRYRVPAGVSSFKTTIFLRASNVNGEQIFFPRVP